MTGRTLPWKLVALISAFAVAIGGVATGAIPSGDGTINACYSSDGSVRVIDNDAGKTCNKGWAPLSWSQRGVPGPQGPPGEDGRDGHDGAQGPQGERGPAGPASSGAKLILVRRTVIVPGARVPSCDADPATPCFPIPQATFLTVTVTCPDGTHGLPPGKAETDGGSSALSLTAQQAKGVNSWQATFKNSDTRVNDQGHLEPVDREGHLELRCLEASVETVNVDH
jgi:hypothetical protein